MAQSSLGYTPGGGKQIASYSFTEGGQTVDIERIAPGAGVMDGWDDTATVTATGLVSGFSVISTGRGRIIVGAETDAAADTYFSYRLLFKDASANVIGLSAEISPTITSHDDGGSPASRYAAASVIANDMCASTVEILVTAMPSGATSLDLKMSAV